MSDNGQEKKEKGFGKHRLGCPCGFCAKLRTQLEVAARKEASGQKIRRRLTVRAKRFVGEYTNPTGQAFGKPSKAARLAGYSPDSADSSADALLRSERVQGAILAGMERQGITGEFRAQKLREGLESKETKFFQHEGRVIETREVVDFYARHKYLETAMRTAGDFPKDEPVQQAALIVNLGDEALKEGDWASRLEAIEAGMDVCQYCKAEHPSSYDCRQA